MFLFFFSFSFLYLRLGNMPAVVAIFLVASGFAPTRLRGSGTRSTFGYGPDPKRQGKLINYKSFPLARGRIAKLTRSWCLSSDAFMPRTFAQLEYRGESLILLCAIIFQPNYPCALPLPLARSRSERLKMVEIRWNCCASRFRSGVYMQYTARIVVSRDTWEYLCVT